MQVLQKNSKYKLLNLSLFLISLLVAGSLYGYVYFGYCINNCSTEFITGFINPFYYYFYGFAVISGLFLILPSRFFKRWLIYIFPIATIIIFFHASDVSVHTSGVLNMSRGQVVRFDMFVLGVVSALFVIGSFIYARVKNKK